MFSLKNVWSCDDPNFNPAFHISVKNLSVMAMLCILVAYIRYEPGISTTLWATKTFAYGFIAMMIIKTSRAFELLYGSSFNASATMLVTVCIIVGLNLHFIDSTFYKVLCMYLSFIPLRIFLGLKLKKKNFNLHGDSYA